MRKFLNLVTLFTFAARVIMDRESGRSRGFGFVSFTSSEEANEAISNMDGKVITFCRCLDILSDNK